MPASSTRSRPKPSVRSSAPSPNTLAHRSKQPDSNAPPKTSSVNSSDSPSPYSSEASGVLSPQQRAALDKLLTGCNFTAAAHAAGVTRMTLYRWLHRDPKFQAAYNAWQQDALLNVRSRLLSMADSAVDTVGQAVQKDPRLAFNFLKSLGGLDLPTPGPTDPHEVERQMRQTAPNRKPSSTTTSSSSTSPLTCIFKQATSRKTLSTILTNDRYAAAKTLG